MVAFTLHLLRGIKYAVDFTKTEDDISAFNLGNSCIDNFVFFIFKLGKEQISFGFTDALDDNLFGSLAGDPTKLFLMRQWDDNFFTNFSGFVNLFSFVKS